jgi:hypothetical protein
MGTVTGSAAGTSASPWLWLRLRKGGSEANDDEEEEEEEDGPT